MYLHKLSDVEIDIMIGEILQKQMRHPLIMMSVAYYSEEFFPSLLKKEGFEKETIQSAILKIHYDFEHYIDGNLPYQAIMILIDDKGKTHQGEVLGSEAVSTSFFDKDFTYEREKG